MSTSAPARFLRKHRGPIVAFLCGLAIYGALAGARLGAPSRDNHFVLQADAWLNGRVSIDAWPKHADDPARVESVRLEDGRTVRGRRLASKAVFRTTQGDEVPVAQIAESMGSTSYMSFPPFPAVLLMPQTAIAGRGANDVVFTVVVAACIPALFLLLCRRLRAQGLLARPAKDDPWFVALLAFGTVLFFCAVQGRVWFTAHVVGVALAIAYLLFAIGARRPFWAGLALACAFLTRAPMLFLAPVFIVEVLRVHPADRRAQLRSMLVFGAPVMLLGLLAAWHNVVRFESATEFGHTYLAVRQQAQIERFGLFDFSYVSRNLSVLLALLPEWTNRAPFFQVSGHGLALWITTPVLLYLIWPTGTHPLRRALWLGSLGPLVATLLYQNSGWLQFGARFALDYLVLWVVLLAVDPRPLTRRFRALILAGVAVNLAGALVFDRVPGAVRSDAKTYECVVRH